METDYLRDYAMYAAIFGMFGFAWFGWAQENPPKKLRALLGIGSAVGFITACIGGYLAYKQWGSDSALNADGAYELFGIVVGIELISALLGALYLTKHSKQQYVAAWIAFIVGIHFVPLAVLFHDPWLYALAGAIILAVVVSLRFKLSRIKENTLVCILTGSILLAFGFRGLLLFAGASN